MHVKNNFVTNMMSFNSGEILCTMLKAALQCVLYSNGNASEAKAKESFDNGVFFDIEAKRTASTVSKLFSKRSEHIR
jgi:hypothetical protein